MKDGSGWLRIPSRLFHILKVRKYITDVALIHQRLAIESSELSSIGSCSLVLKESSLFSFGLPFFEPKLAPLSSKAAETMGNGRSVSEGLILPPFEESYNVA